MAANTVAAQNGAAAEEIAVQYLQRAGLTLVARNYRSPFGEIDLIMQQKQTTVFVEVRFRGRSNFGTPAETIDARKQARLRATAEHYLQRDKHASKRPCRFDIVAIVPASEGDRVEWLRDAF
jgi:putative endonuclease